jgi:hypothetical protein
MDMTGGTAGCSNFDGIQRMKSHSGRRISASPSTHPTGQLRDEATLSDPGIFLFPPTIDLWL